VGAVATLNDELAPVVASPALSNPHAIGIGTGIGPGTGTGIGPGTGTGTWT
jgi:hypothetical protein